LLETASPVVRHIRYRAPGDYSGPLVRWAGGSGLFMRARRVPVARGAAFLAVCCFSFAFAPFFSSDGRAFFSPERSSLGGRKARGGGPETGSFRRAVPGNSLFNGSSAVVNGWPEGGRLLEGFSCWSGIIRGKFRDQFHTCPAQSMPANGREAFRLFCCA